MDSKIEIEIIDPFNQNVKKNVVIIKKQIVGSKEIALTTPTSNDLNKEITMVQLKDNAIVNTQKNGMFLFLFKIKY